MSAHYTLASLVMGKRQLTREEKDMAAKMKAAIAGDRDRTEDGAALAAGVTQGQVSHWTNGRLAVPAKRAPALAGYLGLKPEDISVAYRELMGSGPVVPDDLANNRLENDIDALRHVIDAMAVVMVTHRPRESAELVRALRRNAPAKFLRRGYIHLLLQTLEAARPAAVTAPDAAQPPAKRRRQR